VQGRGVYGSELEAIQSRTTRYPSDCVESDAPKGGVEGLDPSERPSTATTKRRIYRGNELAQTLAAATAPWKTLFALASVAGARLSECLGLVWEDLSIDDLDAAEVRLEFQVDTGVSGSPSRPRSHGASWRFRASSQRC
jgi:integrase